MAKDSPDRLIYYLSVDTDRQHDLAHIRHWNNLKIGFDSDTVWLKDLDYAQVHSVEVKSLPFKKIYYENKGRLFLLNSLLPETIVPNILWTPIDRGIRVTLPSLNHNFFGLDDLIQAKFVESDHEMDVVAMLVGMNILNTYIGTAPSVRLEKIRWAILNNDQALLLGKPLLPIPGTPFWNHKDMLIPAGYHFEFPVLTDALQKQINAGRDQWILWHADASYNLISKQDLMPLSRSSFRQSNLSPSNRIG